MDYSKYINEHYVYDAKCVSCFDGDTCRLDINMGFKVNLSNKSCRLFGINTPELYKGSEEDRKKGEIARDFLKEQILDKDILLYSVKDKKGKYGRILGILFTKDDDGKPLVNINKLLFDKGYAKLYDF